MLVQPHVDLESLEYMAKGGLDAAVTAEKEAGDVLEVTGAHPLLPSHHQLEGVAVDGDKEEDEVDVCPQLYQGAE